MKTIRLGICLVCALVATSCAGTLRSTTRTFGTGRSLKADEVRASVTSTIYPLAFLGGLGGELGLGEGWQVGAGYGIHGIQLGDSEEDTLHGPEFSIRKEIVDVDGVFYLDAGFAVDINVVPEFDATIFAGPSLGLYPVDWLAIFVGAQGGYLIGGTPGLMIHGGLGVDGPLYLLLSAYGAPIALTRQADGPAVYVPIGINASVGARFGL